MANGKNACLLDLSGNYRLWHLDLYCRPALRRARLMDLRRLDSRSDWAAERFGRVLGTHRQGHRLAPFTAKGSELFT
jgi:hypothetical protein